MACLQKYFIGLFSIRRFTLPAIVLRVTGRSCWSPAAYEWTVRYTLCNDPWALRETNETNTLNQFTTSNILFGNSLFRFSTCCPLCWLHSPSPKTNIYMHKNTSSSFFPHLGYKWCKSLGNLSSCMTVAALFFPSTSHLPQSRARLLMRIIVFIEMSLGERRREIQPVGKPFALRGHLFPVWLDLGCVS